MLGLATWVRCGSALSLQGTSDDCLMSTTRETRYVQMVDVDVDVVASNASSAGARAKHEVDRGRAVAAGQDVGPA